MVFLTVSGTISTYIRKFQYQTLKKVINELRIMIILMYGVKLYFSGVLVVEGSFPALPS